MKMKFVCLDCEKVFEQEVEQDLAEILLDVQEVGGGEILQSSCPDCRHGKRV